MRNNVEKILCAAISYQEDNLILYGFRHHTIIKQYFDLFGKTTEEGKTIQGFLKSHNHFVDRKTASLIAFNAGQIKEDKFILFSEDLY